VGNEHSADPTAEQRGSIEKHEERPKRSLRLGSPSGGMLGDTRHGDERGPACVDDVDSH
jgi:hypothetical protein